MEKYEQILKDRENVKEKRFARERARKMSNDEVNENARQAGVTTEDLNKFIANLER